MTCAKHRNEPQRYSLDALEGRIAAIETSLYGKCHTESAALDAATVEILAVCRMLDTTTPCTRRTPPWWRWFLPLTRREVRASDYGPR